MLHIVIEILYSFGLFFGGIVGIAKYSASYSSSKFIKFNSSSALKYEFFKSIGITCLASDGGQVVTFSTAALLTSGLLDYKIALFAIFGAVVASTSASYFVIFDSRTLVIMRP
jgi:hypothetical protein